VNRGTGLESPGKLLVEFTTCSAYCASVRLLKAQLESFEDGVCTAFAQAAQGLELARKAPQERTQIARGFLHGYTRGSLSHKVEEMWEGGPQVERVTRGMVEYAMYVHLLGYKFPGLMRPREFMDD
jgi:hypothetical protein